MKKQIIELINSCISNKEYMLNYKAKIDEMLGIATIEGKATKIIFFKYFNIVVQLVKILIRVIKNILWGMTL